MKFGFIFVLLIYCVEIVSAQNPQQGWSFDPPLDHYTNEAMLDLRYLNEAEAGENGFITLSTDSNSFVTTNGTPMRFWAINGATLAKDMYDYELARYARFLAKMGVNMIRYHGSVQPINANDPLDKINNIEVDRIQRVVTAMKKEGIYTVISPFYANMVKDIFANWGIDGYEANDKKLWEVIFFHDGLKNAYKEWIKDLYTSTNPYTGIQLKDEPAVAIIQTQNEDGVFWYTISDVKPELKKIIMQKYYNWLLNKYGTINDATSAWSGASISGDNPGAGEMDLYHIWDATQNLSGGKDARMSDQIQFLAETQRSFYNEIHDHLRSLGCNQLINGGNWKAASATRLLDSERWTNADCEVMAVNRYYSPDHEGTNSGWRIDPGHYYAGKSALFNPNKLPINIKQLVKHPFIVTESGWNLPHKYQAEGPFLISAYMSLTGIDGFFWFNTTSSGYDPEPYYTWTSMNGGQHPLSRWSVSIPGQIGMFPANALTFRQGYVSEGDVIVREERKLNSLWKRKVPVISEDGGFDPNRDLTNPGTEDTQLSPLTYLTGKVQVNYDSDSDSAFINPSLGDLIDFNSKTVKSSTNQLIWDYNKGICVLDAPASQGVCGFVGQTGEFDLSDVKISTSNYYAAINVVSMDGRTINKSGKILIQVGTVYRPTGWQESPAQFDNRGELTDGFLIQNTGTMPWKVANTEVSITIKNSVVDQAFLLDAGGYSKGVVNLTKNEGETSLTLPEDAMYVILKGDAINSSETKLQDGNMKIFPNPSSGNFMVEIPGFESGEMSFEVRSLTGQKIWERKQISEKKLSVNLFGKYRGLYLAVLKNEKGIIAVRKIRIE